MSQFFRQDYLKPAYFKVGYLRGADEEPTSDGRSAYWRMFFMQLQEEALKKPKSEEAKPVEATPAAKKRRKAKVVPLLRQDDFAPPSLPPFRRIPIYTQPDSYDALAELPPLSVQTYNEPVVIRLHQEQVKRRKQARRRAAALLLLAA